MAKLLLINPLFAGCDPIYPLGIAHVAAACRDAADVQCLDMNMLEQPFNTVSRKLSDYQPDFVGIGLRNMETTDSFFSYLPSFFSLISLIKKALPKCKVIVGGGGFSIMPKAIMESHAGIDFGVNGSGETILALLSHDNQENCCEIWHREGNKIHPPCKRESCEKTAFRWYPYEVLNEIIPVDDYWRANPAYGIGIQTKRGCARACSYCVYPELEGSKLFSRTMDEVLADISFLYKKGVTRFFISDSVANDLPQEFQLLCNEIKKMSLPITWGGWFREDQINAKTAKLAYEAGCDWFSFSPDGSCQPHLELLKKELTMEQIKEAARVCAELPIRVMFHFFVNLPGETKQTIRETYENIKELHRFFAGQPEFVGVTCKNIRVYPGTNFHRLVSQNSDNLPDDLLMPYFYNPSPYDKLKDIFESICARLLAQVKQNNTNFNDIDDYFSFMIENNIQA